jgi:hypothetical protein
MMNLMEHLMVVFVVGGTLILSLAVGLDYSRRELIKKRKDYRMRQALRRGLAQPDGGQLRNGPRVLSPLQMS